LEAAEKEAKVQEQELTKFKENDPEVLKERSAWLDSCRCDPATRFFMAHAYRSFAGPCSTHTRENGDDCAGSGEPVDRYGMPTLGLWSSWPGRLLRQQCPAQPMTLTDNIFSIQSYCSNHFGISGSDFLRQFDLPETFDSINEEDAFAPPPTKGSKSKATSAPAEKWRKASEAADDGEGAAGAGEADGADFDAGDFE